MVSRQYCTYAQFASRYDVRKLADLSSDSGTSTTDPSTSSIVADALTDASADIDSAIKAGKTYTEGQLDELLSRGDQTLVRLCATLAMGYMYARRGAGVPDGHQRLIDRAEDTLRDLARGEMVLGTVTDSAQTPSAYRPSDAERRRLFPASTLPIYPSMDGRGA